MADSETTWDGLENLRGILTTHWPKLYYLTISEKGSSTEDRVAKIEAVEDRNGTPIPRWDDQEEGIDTLLSEVRLRCERHSTGLASMRFKVILYAKGSGYLESCVIVVRSPGESGGDEGAMSQFRQAVFPNSTIPPLAPSDGPIAVAFNTLAVAYGQFYEQIVFPGMRQLHTMYQDVSDMQKREFSRVVGALEEAHKEMRIMRVQVETVQAEASTEAHNAKARGEVAKTAIEEVAGLGRTFMGLKAGVPPGVVDLLQSIGDDKDLMATLGKKEVREMLAQTENREYLRTMLEGAIKKPSDEDPPAEDPTKAEKE